MRAPQFLDDILIGLFRFNTRGFLRMRETDGAVPPPPAGGGCHLYVHIPFCEVLCPFCSFHRVQHCPAQAQPYFKALREEITLYHRAGHRFEGAYFGGGTPTIEPAELVQTIRLVRTLFPVREVSVETNPKDLTPEVLQALQDCGVTRLSVGVQSFDDTLLREMGRHEKYGGGAEIFAHIRRAARRFPTVNVDLIFNQPHQTLASLRHDLDLARASGANQISCYPLMTSPAVLKRMAATMGRPDRRRLRHFYDAIHRSLGWDYTPVSAWCFARQRGTADEYIVNTENYVGVGSGAFSYLDGTLYATTFSLRAYVERVARGLTGLTARHPLSAIERMRYTLLVKLFGLELDFQRAGARHGRGFFVRLLGELLTLRLLGAVERGPRGWVPTMRGRYWLMLMMSEFFESVNAYRDEMRKRVASDNGQTAEGFDRLKEHRSDAPAAA